MRETGWEDTSAPNADFTGADLRAADITWGGFSGATFRRADLRDARLHSIYADFRDRRTDFRHADLRRADLTDASLAGANFDDARLAGADFSSARLGFSSFAGADLRGVTWSNTTCPDGTNSDANGGTCLGHL